MHTSFLDRVPGARSATTRKLLPLMNAAFESFDLSGFDLVVSSSHSCAKNVLTGAGTLHVCYCHTPMRHAWEPRFLAGELGRASGLRGARMMLGRLRRDDLAGAEPARRLRGQLEPRRGADPQVLPPRGAWSYTRRSTWSATSTARAAPDDYYLVLGRVVPYKRVELAVGACATLGRPVKVVGEGRGLDAARAAAGPGAEFLGYVADDEVDALLSGARALLFPGEEDFGIVPVEAQAAGVPVIAYGAGGVRDTVIENETGVFHAEQTVTSVASAILQAESMRFDDYRLRANARRFGRARFRAEMTDVLLEHAPGGGRQVSATPDLRFEPERERDSVGYALGVLRRRWLVVVAGRGRLPRRRRGDRRRRLDRPLREQRPRAVRHVDAVRRGAAAPARRQRPRARGGDERPAGRLRGGRRERAPSASGCRPRSATCQDKIEVEAEQNANVLQITATDEDPQQAARDRQRVRQRVRGLPGARRPARASRPPSATSSSSSRRCPSTRPSARTCARRSSGSPPRTRSPTATRA